MNNLVELSLKEKSLIYIMGFISFLNGAILSVIKLKSFVNVLPIFAFSLLVFIAILFYVNHLYVINNESMLYSIEIKKALFLYCFMYIVNSLCLCLPGYYSINLVTALIFAYVFEKDLGIFLGLALVGIQYLSINSDTLRFSCAIFELIVGFIIAKELKNKRFKLYLSSILLLIAVTVNIALNTIITGKLSFYNYVITVIIGILTMGISILFFNVEKKEPEEKFDTMSISLGNAIEDDFVLVKLIKNTSKTHYSHARACSMLAYKIAKELGFNENLVACAAFYYSFCDNTEPEPIEYAVKLLRKHGIPQSVINIVQEYKGIYNPISSSEAALIDLIDSALKLLRKKKLLSISPIEREIYIVTHFNELSSTGRYDNSGLSMNRFIKLRDILIKEVNQL